MALSDKNRKILWARSGNRCAICRHELVVEKFSLDTESVIGEECHIISSSPEGPRFDSAYPISRIDDLDNFVLLCRIHHKMIDDQCETYPAARIRRLKQDHEKWVQGKLDGNPHFSPPRIRRIRANIPTHLERITKGLDLFALASGCHGQYQHHEPELSDSEIELVGGFLQEFKDWMELDPDEPMECLRIKKRLSEMIKEIEGGGFLVFAGRENQILEGGVGGPTNWTVLHLSVLRNMDSSIVYSNHANK